MKRASVDAGVPGRPRVLLARPDHLGDVLLTLPAAVGFRASVPHANVTYLVNDGLAPVPARCRGVDNVLTATFPPPDAEPDPPSWR